MIRPLTAVRAGLGIGVVAAVIVVAAPSAAATSSVSGAARAAAQLPTLRKEAANGTLVNWTATGSRTPPAGSISPNLKFLSNLPLPTAISIHFIRNTAFVSTVGGVYSVDISDPTNPQLLGAFPTYIWENEHVQVDPQRNLLFISRDPRGFTTPATTAFPYGAIQVIDVSNPRAMVQIGYHMEPTGHTSACINNCQSLWVMGPASPAIQIPGGADPRWGGRPTWGLDISNPTAPKDCPHFIDLNNHNGATDYDHDVDVDASGVAWISGSGHIRGYWTRGQHFNWLTGRVETATACDPIPYAGADTNEGQLLVQGGVMHNSFRDLGIAVDGRRGDVLAATEEVTVTDCATSGRFVTYDIGGTKHAQGWTNPKLTLRKLGQWTPQNQPGSTGCDSAHWFTDRGNGLIAQAFYTQGTRLLDIRDPYHIKQVGWYNVADQSGKSTNDTWATYWHGNNYIYVADFTRGLDILRYVPATAAATATQASAALPLAVLIAGGVVAVLPFGRLRRFRRSLWAHRAHIGGIA